MLEMHGASRLLTSFNDAIPGFIFSGLFFTDEYLGEHPEKVRAFLRGLVEAFDFIRNHDTEARKWIPKYAGVEMDVAMKSALREFNDGRESEEQIYRQQAMMIQMKFLPEKVPVGKFVDYQYLPEPKENDNERGEGGKNR
jgi:ABC-type nitrate/sulfonate/bicarbonate transport system substrate-binding protein